METIVLFIFLVFFALLLKKDSTYKSCNCSDVEHFLSNYNTVYQHQKEYRLPMNYHNDKFVNKNSNLEYLNTDKYFRSNQIKESLTYDSLRQILDEAQDKLNNNINININFDIIKAKQDNNLDEKLNIYKPLFLNIINYINSFAKSNLTITDTNIINFESYTDNNGTKLIKYTAKVVVNHPLDNLYRSKPIKCELSVHLIVRKRNNNLELFIKDIYSMDWT